MSDIKIAHIINSIDKSTGGPARSVTQLIHAVLKNDPNCGIYLETLEAANDPVIKEFSSLKGKISFNKSNIFGHSSSLKKNLFLHKAHLFHGHGLWQMPVHQMAKIARKKNVPYVITPRGMLEPWALQQGKFKKRMALKLFQFKDLKEATCIHATAPMEVESIRAVGLKKPIAMIPNGVDLKYFSEKPQFKSNKPKKILFLSRIHHKKGLEMLIDSFSELDKDLIADWQLDIVGNGEKSYIDSLKERINEKSLSQVIKICEPVYDETKYNMFAKASLFVLPTYSENFGIVVAEALASHTPVITTKGAPWEDLEKFNCGWWIDINKNALIESLEDALKMSDDELRQMGSNGRKLIESKYSIEAVGRQMITLYQWLLNGGKAPKFVDLCQK